MNPKPTLFHDIDGVLYGVYDEEFQLRPGVKPWLKWALDVIGSLERYQRGVLDNKVDELIVGLIRDTPLSTDEPMSSLYGRLGSKDDDFFKAALFYVWCDYNWFKHRPRGYPVTVHPRKDSRVQFALALRAYRGLCSLYTWCYNLAPVP